MHIDRNGLIFEGSDGGDTCQRMYTVYLRQAILAYIKDKTPNISGIVNVDTAQLLLETAPGIYVRNPDRSQWYSDPGTTSRDQLIAPLCYHAHSSYHGNSFSQKAIRRLLWACLKRGMFAQNIRRNWEEPGTKMPDFMDPGLWAIFIRSSKLFSILLYPILLILDIFNLLNVSVNLWAPLTKDGTLQFRSRGPDDVDDDNLNNIIMTSQYTIGTPFSWLARKLYKRYRKENCGNIILKETNNILGAMAWYHRLPYGNPEVVDLARPIVERY